MDRYLHIILFQGVNLSMTIMEKRQKILTNLLKHIAGLEKVEDRIRKMDDATLAALVESELT